jgi:putative Holliday junction resolvase
VRILCLDVGEKRIGVAKSDPLGIVAEGICYVPRPSDAAAIERICALIAQWEAELILVGQPFNMNGTLGPQAEKVARFTQKLHKQTNCPIKEWDERLTTKEAERILIDANVSRKKRKEKIDQLAATIILQSYLDSLTPGMRLPPDPD